MNDLNKLCLKVSVKNNRESVFVQEQFFRLGGRWYGSSNSLEQNALEEPYLFLDKGFIGHSSSDSYFNTCRHQLVSVTELEDYVTEELRKEIDKHQANGRITWQKAYTVMAEGGEVQIWNGIEEQWDTLTHYNSWSIVELSQELLRVKPVMIHVDEGEYSEEGLIKLMGNFK